MIMNSPGPGRIIPVDDPPPTQWTRFLFCGPTDTVAFGSRVANAFRAIGVEVRLEPGDDFGASERADWVGYWLVIRVAQPDDPDTLARQRLAQGAEGGDD